MDSKRRMIEIHIWDEPFFSELSQTEKLLYWLMICKCDNVGVYRHNPKLAEFHCEGEIDLQSFIDKVNFDQERLEIISEGTLWIKDFVRDTWGTIAAGNNLGLSCYKLLVKHDLLGRFISEHPNCINVASFREAITEGKKGYAELPLPQGSPKAGAESAVSNEYEGQGSPKAATINNIINGNKDITITNGSVDELIKKELSESTLAAVTDPTFKSDIDVILDELTESDVKDPKQYLIEQVKATDWTTTGWKDFKESMLTMKELPF